MIGLDDSRKVPVVSSSSSPPGPLRVKLTLKARKTSTGLQDSDSFCASFVSHAKDDSRYPSSGKWIRQTFRVETFSSFRHLHSPPRTCVASCVPCNIRRTLCAEVSRPEQTWTHALTRHPEISSSDSVTSYELRQRLNVVRTHTDARLSVTRFDSLPWPAPDLVSS